MAKLSKAKYRKGQVVCLSKLEYYTKDPERKKQLYQVITEVRPWSAKCGGFELVFANGDRCHHTWVRPLGNKEIGGA